MKRIFNKRKLKQIYHSSFPKSERFPFWLLIKSLKSKNVIFDDIKNDGDTIGMKYVIVDKNIAYLMYFAIERNKRNNGFGGEALKALTKKYDTVLLSIEKVDDNNKLSKRRKEFYLRNGFFETHKYTKQNNVTYEVLSSNNNYVLTKEKLIDIYKKMSCSKMMGYFINKKFKLFNVNFIDEMKEEL